MYDQMPMYIAIPLAIVFWGMFLWMKYRGKERIQNYLAQRRHMRRVRAYLRRDIEVTADMFKHPRAGVAASTFNFDPMGRHSKKRKTF